MECIEAAESDVASQKLHFMHAGAQQREAAFEPLAALLLQPEALRHLDAHSHSATGVDEGKTRRCPHIDLLDQQITAGATWMNGRYCCSSICLHCTLARVGSCSASFLTVRAQWCTAESPVEAPHASRVRPSMHMTALHLESDTSIKPSAVQLQLAERIADAVAARLNQTTLPSPSERPQQFPSSAQTSRDAAAAAHAAPQAADVVSQGAARPVPAKHSEAAAESSVRSLERNESWMQACEDECLAALLQGSPGRPSHAEQPGHPQPCEQDFLAALLLGSPGVSDEMSHAASPGLMHKDSCSTSEYRASPVADSRAEPWTAQWAGKLTQQQMETAVQEVKTCQLPCLPHRLANDQVI